MRPNSLNYNKSALFLGARSSGILSHRAKPLSSRWRQWTGTFWTALPDLACVQLPLPSTEKGSLRNDDGEDYENVNLKSDFALPQT